MHSEHDAMRIFAGGDEMGRLCRETDWSATPLGPVEGWPQSLRTAAGMVITSAFANIVLWGPDLVQIYNDGYIPITGAKHPWALGRPTRECWPEVWEFNEPIYARVLRGETVSFEDQLYRLQRRGPDAPPEDVYITLCYSPVPDETDGVGGVLVTLFDTTAQVAARALQAERERLFRELELERARLEFVFQQAPAFLAVLRGPQHVFELANDAYYQLVGHRDILGKPVLEALPEIRGQGFMELLDGVLETGEPFVGREAPVTVICTPGAPPEERFIDFVYLPLVEADGTRSGIIAHGSDVTEQVLARRAVEAANAQLQDQALELELSNQQLQEQASELEMQAEELQEQTEAAERARAEAEAANRAKSEFLAVMSHELRTPLNAIGGYAELMEMGIRGPVTEHQREDLARIQQSQQHLLGLINEVLNYARIGTGTVRYDAAEVSLAEVVASVEPLVAPQLAARGLSYAVASPAPGARPLVARADRDKVRQVLLNLLSNAVKFTEPGGEVTVACEALGERVAVRIRDTGIGIAPAELERVFEPFVQVDATLTRTQAGTGLGLAISRDLARGMGGDLTAESEPGVGSVFTLTLPRAE